MTTSQVTTPQVNDPYKVLDLPFSADDNAVRTRYLELVRAHPPERDPERFAAVRAAYEALRDPVTVWENRLFSVESLDTLDGLAGLVQTSAPTKRYSTDVLLSLGED